MSKPWSIQSGNLTSKEAGIYYYAAEPALVNYLNNLEAEVEQAERYKALAQELYEALMTKLPTCDVQGCGLAPTYSYRDYDSDPEFACSQHRLEVLRWHFERAGDNPGYKRDLEKRWTLFEYHDDDSARAALSHYEEAMKESQ